MDSFALPLLSAWASPCPCRFARPDILHRVVSCVPPKRRLPASEIAMKVSRLVPMLPIKSMPAGAAFYRKPGFDIEQRKDEWRWAMLRFGEFRLMKDESINAHPSLPRTSELYLYPDDVAGYRKQLRGNGLDIPGLETSVLRHDRIPHGGPGWEPLVDRTTGERLRRAWPRATDGQRLHRGLAAPSRCFVASSAASSHSVCQRSNTAAESAFHPWQALEKTCIPIDGCG